MPACLPFFPGAAAVSAPGLWVKRGGRGAACLAAAGLASTIPCAEKVSERLCGVWLPAGFKQQYGQNEKKILTEVNRLVIL